MIQTLKRESSRDAIKTNGTENNQNIAGGQSSKNNDGINTSVHGSIHIGTETVLNSKYKDVRKGEMHQLKHGIDASHQLTQEDETLTGRALKPKYSHRKNKNT